MLFYLVERSWYYILRIGVLSYNQALTNKAVFEIAENEMDANIIKKAKSYMHSYVDVSDGTRYESIVLNGTVKWLKFDQIVFVDDSRWEIYNKYYTEIKELECYCLSPLFNGLDAQIIKYEW